MFPGSIVYADGHILIGTFFACILT